MAVLRRVAYLGKLLVIMCKHHKMSWLAHRRTLYSLRLGFLAHSLALVDRGMGGSSGKLSEEIRNK